MTCQLPRIDVQRRRGVEEARTVGVHGDAALASDRMHRLHVRERQHRAARAIVARFHRDERGAERGASRGANRFAQFVQVHRAALSADAAMERAGVHPGELDIIVIGTASPDRLLPSAAVDLQAALGASRAAAFDVGAACSGFIYSATVAESMIAAGNADTALVIGVEKLSAITDWKDRSTCVLFGDGAGAAVLKRSKHQRGILSTFLRSDGSLRSDRRNPYLAADSLPIISTISRHALAHSRHALAQRFMCSSSGNFSHSVPQLSHALAHASHTRTAIGP